MNALKIAVLVLLVVLTVSCRPERIPPWTVVATQWGVATLGVGVSLRIEYVSPTGGVVHWERPYDPPSLASRTEEQIFASFRSCWTLAKIGEPLPECARVAGPLPVIR